MTGLRECAVCLGEYAAGERIKVVPACAHGFHADCIDLWLATKTTCPICRTDLKPEAPITQQGDSQVVVTATGRGVTEGTGGEETAAVPPGAAIDSSSSGG
ncbi:hypothetical protein CLOM_g21614 [Closterium sp. NIES-68]|nr:hypothetical protein CLOM_g21614 [Closterium sp. NIES-68]GJP72940.1 hypothetical protein CLOP_g3708 [Closterium sp. NIES-67]